MWACFLYFKENGILALFHHVFKKTGGAYMITSKEGITKKFTLGTLRKI